MLRRTVSECTPVATGLLYFGCVTNSCASLKHSGPWNSVKVVWEKNNATTNYLIEKNRFFADDEESSCFWKRLTLLH